MPALPDQDPPIMAASYSPQARPQHPSPTVDGLRLEVMSNRELAYWGHVWGVDTPYLFWFTGWGEIIPDIWSSGP